jgi:uncharacterized protein (TIGR04255 family)
MTSTEIFPHPTVKKVIFQIRFPNLFFIEKKIGDFQMKIMKKFPESSLLFRRRVMLADIGPEGKLENLPEEIKEKSGNQVWQFKAENKVQLNVLNDSLDISSEHHKTYNLEGGDKFRDIIEYVVSNFLEITPLSTISRIGLRYIDECPIQSRDNETFKTYYNSVFPLDRFKIEDAKEMDFKTVINRGSYKIRYIEMLTKDKLILDFDGFAEKISPDEYLKVTDDLHEIIKKEYFQTIKEPVIEYMRRQEE